MLSFSLFSRETSKALISHAPLSRERQLDSARIARHETGLEIRIEPLTCEVGTDLTSGFVNLDEIITGTDEPTDLSSCGPTMER